MSLYTFITNMAYTITPSAAAEHINRISIAI